MNAIYNFLVYFVWFLATYYTIFFFLSLYIHRNMLFEDKKSVSRKRRMVSVLIPAYNEEKDIAETIRSLKKLDYRRAEFIIINDGSSDNTSSIVNKSIRGDKRFRFIDNKVNSGKAACLNNGIAQARGEFIACMDADSVIDNDIMGKVLPYFNDPKVGAVTVTVQVKNPKTFLHKIIDLEFTLGLSLFLKLFSFLECVFVTPGPFSIYRRSVLNEIGGYDTDNITEDHEIAFRLHKHGYKIRNCMEAKVYTTLPDTFKGIYIQRRRWYSGAIQTLFQHKDIVFKKEYGLFGFFIPFNYSLIGLGLVLFGASTYLLFSKTLDNILYFKYTNFNFLDHIFDFNWDILNYSRVNLLGMGLFVGTVVLMLMGLKFTRKKYSDNKLGLLGYPFLFFLYQLYWGGAILAAIRGKRVKWR